MLMKIKDKEFRNLIHSVTYLFDKHSRSTYYISSTMALKEANIIKCQPLGSQSAHSIIEAEHSTSILIHAPKG